MNRSVPEPYTTRGLVPVKDVHRILHHDLDKGSAAKGQDRPDPEHRMEEAVASSSNQLVHSSIVKEHGVVLKWLTRPSGQKLSGN